MVCGGVLCGGVLLCVVVCCCVLLCVVVCCCVLVVCCCVLLCVVVCCCVCVVCCCVLLCVVVVVVAVMDDGSRICLSTPGTPNTMHQLPKRNLHALLLEAWDCGNHTLPKKTPGPRTLISKQEIMKFRDSHEYEQRGDEGTPKTNVHRYQDPPQKRQGTISPLTKLRRNPFQTPPDRIPRKSPLSPPLR